MNRKSSEVKNKAMYFNGLQVNFTGSNPVSPTIKSLKYKGFFITADDLRLMIGLVYSNESYLRTFLKSNYLYRRF